MAIKPYVSGSVPEQIDVGVVGDDGLSTPLNVTIAADAGKQHADAYTPEIAVKSGEPDYRSRFRGALTEGAWSAWGVLPTIQPVTDSGTVMAIQGRWLSGDPATARVASLVLPQEGITIVEGGELPPIVDTGEGTDTGTVDAVVPLPDATDSGEGTDTAVLDSAGDPSLGEITDSGEGTDSATLDRVVVVPDVTDSGEGTDVGSLDTVVPAKDTYFFDANPSPNIESDPDTLKTTFASSAPVSALEPLVGYAWIGFSAGGTSVAMQAAPASWGIRTYSFTPTSSFNSITLSSGTSTTINFGKTYPAGTPVEVRIKAQSLDPYYTTPNDVHIQVGADSWVKVG